MRRMACLAGACGLLAPLFAAHAQTNSYKLTPLVSDTANQAPVMDSNLVNPWGICIIPGDPFWISDNASAGGVSSLYTKTGMKQGAFPVAPPTGSTNPATPTGCVGNAAGGFLAGGKSSLFIFDTEDGTISGWTGSGSSILTVDNSMDPTAATGAVYKGLALLSTNAGSFLLATNFRSGKVEVYDSTFKAANLSGTFTDSNPPAVPAGSGSPGYAPFGVKVVTINNAPMVMVTYALQDGPKHDPMKIAGSGFVDLFDQNGNMVRRIAADSHLNAPWGVVIPPQTFGAFGGKLLIGNFGDGTINAFDLNAGTFIDQMKDGNGAVIAEASLWDMVFDTTGQTGDPATMYITAGLSNEMHGLFAGITANTTQGASPDFSISASPAMQTVTAGQSTSYTITLGGLNGFSAAVALTCSGQPAGSTCSFGQSSVAPPSGATITTIMTIFTNSSLYMPAMGMRNGGGALYAAALPVLTVAIFSIFIFRAPPKKGPKHRKTWTYVAANLGLAMVVSGVLLAGGCGYNRNSTGNGTQRGTTTVMITGTSGNLTHTTSVSLTVQ